jgi:hypothetical protein
LNFDETKLYPQSWEKLCLYLAKEGHKLLAAEANDKPTAPKVEAKPVPQAILDTHLTSMSNDPHVKARHDILVKWQKDPKLAWRAQEIEKMEKTGDIHNRHYEEFLTDVDKLARSKYASN